MRRLNIDTSRYFQRSAGINANKAIVSAEGTRTWLRDRRVAEEHATTLPTDMSGSRLITIFNYTLV